MGWPGDKDSAKYLSCRRNLASRLAQGRDARGAAGTELAQVPAHTPGCARTRGPYTHHLHRGTGGREQRKKGQPKGWQPGQPEAVVADRPEFGAALSG